MIYPLKLDIKSQLVEKYLITTPFMHKQPILI